MPHPLVVSKQSGKPYDVYCGRPSKWGNPFHLGAPHPDTGLSIQRGEAIELFAHWLMFTLKGRKLLKEAESELKGKILCCWCAPDDCHCDVIALLVN